jgi:hypothetical protein
MWGTRTANHLGTILNGLFAVEGTLQNVAFVIVRCVSAICTCGVYSCRSESWKFFFFIATCAGFCCKAGESAND